MPQRDAYLKSSSMYLTRRVLSFLASLAMETCRIEVNCAGCNVKRVPEDAYASLHVAGHAGVLLKQFLSTTGAFAKTCLQ